MPITKSAADLRTLSGGELVATLFAAQFPMVYSGEGEGLFSGLERYQYLTTRLVDPPRPARPCQPRGATSPASYR
jgi:hypothetical protein